MMPAPAPNPRLLGKSRKKKFSSFRPKCFGDIAGKERKGSKHSKVARAPRAPRYWKWR